MGEFAAYGSQPGGAIGAALAWIQGVLLGTVATSVAIIAVASLGFMMLTGRIDVRRAGEVVLGCFIIFGAAAIANGIRLAGSQFAGGATVAAQPPPPIYQGSPAPPPQPAAPSGYDPYAGASVGPR